MCCFVKNNGINYSAVRVKVDFSSEAAKSKMHASITYNTTDWQQNGDYWYYKHPLTPSGEGSETTPLFEKVVIDNPEPEAIDDFSVYVYAESRDCEPDNTVAKMITLFKNGPTS